MLHFSKSYKQVRRAASLYRCMATIYPVILAGGSGTRLWPQSRESYPKQFIIIDGARSLFQEACLRFSQRHIFAAPTIVTHENYRFLVRDQLQAINITDATIITEPTAKNTTIACLVATSFIKRTYGNVPMLFTPADHITSREAILFESMLQALPLVMDGSLCIFGIPPTGPHSGYGYIIPGERIIGPVMRVISFVEKPIEDEARAYIAKGALWNSGLYMCTPEALLRATALYAPEFSKEHYDVFALPPQKVYDCYMIPPSRYEHIPSIAIDKAITEKARNLIVVRTAMNWKDLGSWEAVYEQREKDISGNVLRGDTIAIHTKNSHIESTSRLVTAYGLDEIGIIETKDAVFVFPLHAQDAVKHITHTLQDKKRKELTTHTYVHRPWGSYDVLGDGPGFQSKKITILPGGKLSLQRHTYRSEHWVVISGTATVQRGDEVYDLHANESTYIPARTIHQLHNTTTEPCVIIEVQTGTYFGEDDIERLSDSYGRSS